MNFRIFLSAGLSIVLASCAHPNPYAGQERANIKALSPTQVEQFLAGAGAGYAKAAELNHHPGPLHLLELADALALPDAQRAEARRLLESHRVEARAIGARVVQSERDLDALFRRGGVDADELARAVREAAALEGEYRLAHLETHRRLRALLSPQQVARYDELRGYAEGGAGHSH